MYFETFSDLIAMGRHGLYVWLAYGFFLLVLVWNILSPRLAARRALMQARNYWGRQKPHSNAEAE